MKEIKFIVFKFVSDYSISSKLCLFLSHVDPFISSLIMSFPPLLHFSEFCPVKANQEDFQNLIILWIDFGGISLRALFSFCLGVYSA